MKILILLIPMNLLASAEVGRKLDAIIYTSCQIESKCELEKRSHFDNRLLDQIKSVHGLDHSDKYYNETCKRLGDRASELAESSKRFLKQETRFYNDTSCLMK